MLRATPLGTLPRQVCLMDDGSAMGGPGPRTASGMISGLLHKLTPPRIIRDARYIPRFRETCGGQEGQEAQATTWHDHTSGAALTDNFASLLGAYQTSARSLVFFGEQHHQPPVIRAQVQLLAAMSDQRQEDESRTPTRTRKVKYHLHLLMEHFSMLDQPLLDSFQSGRLSMGELCSAYRQHSHEGFRIEMYAPLLLLARERGARVWGGFPPRDWARVVMREGIESVKILEEARTQPSSSSSSFTRFESWKHVSQLSRSHRTFLSSLMKPDEPPRPAKESVTATKGFGPAQALKDSYLAHAASELLCNGHKMSMHADEDPTVEHRNVVLVVAGLGHVEAGFGAPERVEQESLIVLSKPNDSGLWIGGRRETAEANNMSADEPGWDRRLADAVVLYDWVDFEAEAGRGQGKDGKQSDDRPQSQS